MVSTIEPLDAAILCVKENRNFVLQGGAGSGKTETLSQLIQAISTSHPAHRIACITHTNKAAEEIRSRIAGDHYVGTIHSFLNGLCGGFKKNLHAHLSKLFEVDEMQRLPENAYSDKKTQNLEEHARHKKIYEKYAARYFTVTSIRLPKAHGKKEYDASPLEINQTLNNSIQELNARIRKIISEKRPDLITYNDTRFDDFNRMSYGHDGLLEMSTLLFKNYRLMRKILVDKYDCIFVDEYQDTSSSIVSLLLDLPKTGTTIGFFGDSMQSIYSDGIGSVDSYIAAGSLIKIEKDDNYRCSEQVVSFINTLRDDGLQQKVAFKQKGDKIETSQDRQGSVAFYFAVYENKPTLYSSELEKERYTDALEHLTSAAAFDENTKILVLSNKAVAKKGGFLKLYKIFSDRYTEPKDEIDRILTRLQILDLHELSTAFEEKRYNWVLSRLKKTGEAITKLEDKKNIAAAIQQIANYKGNAITAVQLACDLGLLAESDVRKEFIERMHRLLKELAEDIDFQKFEKDYGNDGHTFLKMKKKNAVIEEDYFELQKRALKQRNFYRALLGEDFTLPQASSYFRYQDEQTEFVTMHKTKGTGIENVAVVLDEYFWNEYNFNSVFNPDELGSAKRRKNMKLIYVACSRAMKNLRCIRLISEDEKSYFLKAFEGTKVIEIDLPLPT